ncbi:hypothetical protein CPB83DRAFT_851013 [Crepidotus variabilis]|uniref:ubiquitinyl hydrolase 1 n=1 Tax=Crepidotus variabilis TaxID=179855 RepID=A0A9P6EKE8_9AGAR|nr:hypothetical protein CPB83DRAFT_851013 [Crepidotus variabilis]
MQSDSAASTSSVKRSVADNSLSEAKGRSPLSDQQRVTSSPAAADQNHDIDAYMAESGALDTPPVVSPPSYQESAMQPVTKEEKLQIVKKGKERKMEVGETWYLVSRVWYRRWSKACTGEIDKEGSVTEEQLGPVNNTPLLDEFSNLKSSPVEGVEVEYVPSEVWNLFVQWYGSPLHPLPRAVVARGISKQASIELHPLRLKVFRIIKAQSSSNDANHAWLTISAGETITTLCTKLAALVTSTTQDTPFRVWKIGSLLDDSAKLEFPAADLELSDTKIVDSSESTLEEEGIESDDSFAVEFKQADGWLAEAPSSTLQPAPIFSSNEGFFNRMSSTFSPASSVSTYKSSGLFGSGSSKTPSVSLTLSGNKSLSKTLEPGTLGLGNMGNTCFMNSALQCLGHTKELTDYFLSGVFEDEINRDNPLGMGGAIAEAFGSLLDRIWATSGPSTSYSPRDFKTQLQRFAPQFSGYQQHDSQELVAFLLDGLHEDLNRVLKKPYVEKPDWEGGGDLELVQLAQKSWEGYMKRNDSVIVDLFQGQYQSTLVCPECQKVSITFDPFMYLTLPLPVHKKWKHSVFYVPWDAEKPHVKVPVEIGRDASFKELRQLLGRWMGAIPENLLTLEIFNNRFYKNLDDNVPVGDMSTSDVIVCFELPCNSRQSRSYKRKPDDPLILPVYFCEAKASVRSTYFTNIRSSVPLFGYPLVTVVDQEQAKDVDAMYEAMVKRISRWTANAQDLYTWEIGPSSDIDAVSIRINGYPPVDSITEIREDGKVVTLEATPPPEGDIVDEKPMLVDEADVQTDLRQVGVKQDVFNLRLQTNHKDYGTAFHGYNSSNRWESWEERMEEVDDTQPSLLRDDDALYCEFDEDKKIYYFGEGTRPEHALWDKWDIFTHPELEASKKAASEMKNKGISLQDCLDEFTKEEQLGEDDLWYCPRCKKHQQATKKFDLWKAPDVLVVHLKRFSNNRTLRDKIDTLVDFPIEGLNLSDMVSERNVGKRLRDEGVDVDSLGLESLDEPLVYDLFAVDEHIGGLGGGHYRAYASNHLNNKWYHFDDSYVTSARASDSVNANAYLLFYRRRTESPLGGKSFLKIKGAGREPKLDMEEGGSGIRSISHNEPQLPTPPSEPMDYRSRSSNEMISQAASRVQQYQDGQSDRWLLRSAPSNATSSVSSPPADELPDMDYQESYHSTSFARFLLPDPANKASPTSSNEADADLDGEDFDDPDWEPDAPSLDVKLSSSQSYDWSNEAKSELSPYCSDDPFGDANTQKDSDDPMDTKEGDQGTAI